jgi:hypothetical protein
MAATGAELVLAKQVIDYLFLKHEHIEDLEDPLHGQPFVLSLEMEKWIKDKYPELKEYYCGKEDKHDD